MTDFDPMCEAGTKAARDTHEPSPSLRAGYRTRRHAVAALTLLVSTAVAWGTPTGTPGAEGTSPARSQAAPAASVAQASLFWALAATWPVPPLPVGPLDLAFDGRGRLLVADGPSRSVRVFEAGRETESWSPPTEIARLSPLPRLDTLVLPIAVTVDPQGRIYVLWFELPASGPLPGGGSTLYVERRDEQGQRQGVVRREGDGLDGWRGVIVDAEVEAATGQLLALVDGVAERLDPLTGIRREVAAVGAGGVPLRLALSPEPGFGFAVVDVQTGVLRRYAPDGTPMAWPGAAALPPGRAPRAAAYDARGRLHVLLAADDGSDPGGGTPRDREAIVLGFDGAGRIVSRVDRADAGPSSPPPPADIDWPWSLAIGPDSAEPRAAGAAPALAWSTALQAGQGARLRVHLPAAPALAGVAARPAWSPDRDTGMRAGAALALASQPGGAGPLVVLDGPGGRILSLDPAPGRAAPGAPTASVTVREVPSDTLALAVDGAQRAFLAQASGALGPAQGTWVASADGALGTRLAAGAFLFAADRAQREVLAFQPGDGDRAGSLPAPATDPDAPAGSGPSAGPWPADLALTDDGRLLLADTSSAQVAWADEIDFRRIRGAWAAGLLAGPRRIAAGRLPDGRPAMAVLLADEHVEIHVLPDRSEIGPPGTPEGDAQLVARFRPRRADGRPVAALDLALGDRGTLWLIDGPSRELLSFAPAAPAATPTVDATHASTPPTATAIATATPTPSSDACQLSATLAAGPEPLVLGESAEVVLNMAARCPPRTRVVGADVLLLSDRSGSMRGAKLAAARDAAQRFVELLDVRFHRVGVVRFAGETQLAAPLAADVLAAVRALEGEIAGGGTDLAEALSRARAHLAQAGRTEALPVIVLLTDGRHNAAGDPRAEAEAARAAGVSLYTIGLGDDVDATGLRALAGGSERYFPAPTPGDLYPIYSEILRSVVTSLAGALIIDIASSAEAPPVPGSSRPPALVADDTLRWGRSLLPAEGVTWTWRVRPLRAGTVDVHAGARAQFSDADGARRTLALPTVMLRVVTPTPTPTPPPPAPAYLPAVLRDACPKGARRLAVALLIDTSGSMAGDKLDRARQAARGFLDLLELPDDHAALIGFDAQARLLAPLTGERASLERALGRLAPGEGTRFDRALRLAAATLAGPARPPRSRAAIVLLTDGGAEEDPAALNALAAEIRDAEVALHTVALGADADRDLLAALADQGAAWSVAEPAALEALFRRLAAELPCR